MICILPWISFNTTPGGRARPCGYSEHKGDKTLGESTITDEWNNDLFKGIRRDFIAGRWPSNCSRCEYMESLGGKSKRLVENSFHYDRNKRRIEQTEQDGSLNRFPNWIDIRVGSICNLKCIHCGTGCSTKWGEDKALIGKYENLDPIPDISRSWTTRDDKVWDEVWARIDDIDQFRFIGGEPFASKRHNRFVAELAHSAHAPRIDLHYVTNGLFLDDPTLDMLSRFKSVSLSISIDAVGEVAEFYRFPTRWSDFAAMVQRCRNAPPNLHFKMQWSCSGISMFYLPETIDYVLDEAKLPLELCNIVTFPAHMNAQNLPEALKDEIERRLEPYRKSLTHTDFYIQHMREKSLWSDLGGRLIAYLDDLDRARGTNWRAVLVDMDLERHV